MKFTNFSILSCLTTILFHSAFSTTINDKDSKPIQASVSKEIPSALTDSKPVNKKVKFGYSWVAFEKDYPKGSDKEVKECKTKKTLAKVSTAYWNALRTEGSGTLIDGTQISCDNDDCSCVLNQAPTGSSGFPFKIYASLTIAQKEYEQATIIYIKEFDGFNLPNGKVHNGCFVAIDTDTANKKEIILYVEEKKNYQTIQKTFDGDYVNATYFADCQVLNYSE